MYHFNSKLFDQSHCLGTIYPNRGGMRMYLLILTVQGQIDWVHQLRNQFEIGKTELIISTNFPL